MHVNYEKLKEVLENKKARGLKKTFLPLRLGRDQIHQLEAAGYVVETVIRGFQVYQSIKF